jgi:hypothetical protein
MASRSCHLIYLIHAIAYQASREQSKNLTSVCFHGLQSRNTRLSVVVESLILNKLYKVASQGNWRTGGPTLNHFSSFPVPLHDCEYVTVWFLFLYSLFLFLSCYWMWGHACHFFSTLFSVPVLDPESVRVPGPDPFPVLPFHIYPPVPDTDPICAANFLALVNLLKGKSRP